jgi:5-methylcytosine-specific restriction endonuclease McrA
VRPQDDSYPEAVQAVLAATCSGGLDAGAEALEAIAYPPRDMPRRPTLPRRTVVQVLHRDRFHCRYCNGQTILHPISRLLGTLFPEAYPYHANWKAGLTHPAIIARTSVVDHVIPGTQGGSWTDVNNMVTACWPCNAIKADFTLDQLGWTVQPITDAAWDGLVAYYRQAWELAGRPDAAYHLDWLTLLENADG